ncbi:MAG: phosphatidylserine decarboxylase family protein [Planctomycetota bacterium]|jgi:phosphatidylserine decarboxylase
MPVTGMAKKEIAWFFVLCAILAGVIAGIAYVTGAAWVYAFIAIPALFYCFVLFFFRDPSRTIPDGDEKVVSPADGYITDIVEMEEDEFLKCAAVRVGIFLSIFTPHINRAPVGGTVKYVKFHPGRFHNAMHDDICSKENEANSVGIENGRVSMLVKQIAGVIARRIVCRTGEGDSLEKGQKFGMIKFGSRTELFIPRSSGFTVSVELGQRVRAGSTVIGLLGEKEV